MPSLFVNALARRPEKSVSLEEIIDLIKNPSREFKNTVELLRAEPDESVQDKMKKMLPAVTWSGEFSARNAKGMDEHTGLYVYDFDGVKPSKVKKMVGGLESLVLVFSSPRGNGVKVVLRGPVARDADEHKRVWECGAAVVEAAVLDKIDRSGSDVSRLCFLSFDKHLIEGDGKEFKMGRVGGTDDDEDLMKGVPEPKADFSGWTKGTVREMLWTVGADVSYDKWRNIIWSVTSHLGFHDWVRELLLEWSKEKGGHRAIRTDEDRKTFDAVFGSKGKGITLASLIQEAKRAGWVDWRRMLRRDEDGDIIHDEANLRVVLENHPDLKGRIWMDTITGMQVMKKIESPVVCAISKDGGTIEEPLAFDVLCDIQENVGIGFKSVRTVLTAMGAIAKQRQRNLRREWLDGLQWDGVPRLGRLFIDGFGAEDVERNEALGVSFLSGAAARIMSPGASVQIVPILVGTQGCGKSSGIAALCPDREWFCDSFIDFESKAGYEVVLRSSIVELSELSAVRKADLEKVKQFITQQSVRFRAPYERQTCDHMASWVFIGTTNEEEFLKDTTGNRRFAPIKIVKAKVEKVVKWIQENRDQMWAEAADIARRGLKEKKDAWAVPKKFWDELAIVAEEAREKDPWEERIAEYSNDIVRRKKDVVKSLQDIAIESGIQLRNRADELHLGRILRLSSWEKQTVRIGDKTAKRWCLDSRF